MAIDAGRINCRCSLYKRGSGEDSWSQPDGTWELVRKFWADVGTDTGLGAIRSAMMAGKPASVGKYSFKVRASVLASVPAEDLPAMRIEAAGMVFNVTGRVVDVQDRSQGYILAEEGGSLG